MIRIGLGYDLHRLVEGRKLLLGGIQLPFEKGEDGHSDGDVLFHAITDAILGAAGLGDIGSFFPPEEAKWKNADSAELLKTVIKYLAFVEIKSTLKIKVNIFSTIFSNL